MSVRTRPWVKHFALSSVPVAAIVLVAIFAHFGPSAGTWRAQLPPAPGWSEFQSANGIDEFGEDGYFIRAVQHGYGLFYYTTEYAPRFTRRTSTDAVHSCSGCHSVEDLAHGLVTSDRFDTVLRKRVSFEERVMRCYAQHLDGFVPTIYDPAVRDLRILARAVGHHLQLSEGVRRQKE